MTSAGDCRRPPPDRAAVRRQLDAARRRAARGRLGAEVRQRADERRRPRGGRDRRLDARRADRLHRRARAVAPRSAGSPTPKAPPPPPPAASTAATDEAAAAAEEATDDRGQRPRHVQQRRPAARAADARRDARRRSNRRRRSSTSAPACSAAARTTRSSCARRSTPPSARTCRSIPIDTRGLQAVVPGGDARQASGRGQAMFSGRGVAQQFSQLAASQDTLTSLAADTGGRAFTDTQRLRRGVHARAARHVGLLPARLQQHATRRRTAASAASRCASSATACGSRRAPATIAERDFAHTNRGDRETQLQEQLFSAVSATDLPVLVTGGFFRLAADRYYVPIAVAVPGSAVPVPAGQGQGLARRARHGPRRAGPSGRPHAADLEFPAGAGATLAGKQVLYQSGVTLPPGRFSVKVVVRENATGADRLVRDRV